MDHEIFFTFPLNRITILSIALILDFILGDPQIGFHPIIAVGKLIKYLERRLLRDNYTEVRKKISGLILVLIISILTLTLSYLAIFYSFKINMFFGNAISAIILYFMFCNGSMISHARKIMTAINNKDLEKSRIEVGKIVGRDTGSLSFIGLIRATLESLAENTSDGLIGPLFFYLLGGVPAAFLYKAVNTLDSTVGYRNQKYKDFGFFSAKFDDILNYLPARITALISGFLSFLAGGRIADTFRTIKKYSSRHASPNSGFPESAFAGALGLRFGGINHYFGHSKKTLYIGEKKKDFDAGDIKKGLRLSICSSLFFSIIVILAHILLFIITK
ncbi:MAG: adenosylcobinamide-phosphate synthase CbiB [Actinomycetia bacterium]|nr:adenosylcobinamide-phosphate synthase CbiB [Actinomycetes bacterium]